MPVILVSCDTENTKLHELFDMDKFDYVYMENTEEAEDFLDALSCYVPHDHVYYLSDLKTDVFAVEKMKSLFRRFDHVKTGNVLIISHQSFFQSVGLDVTEWQPLAFQSF